MNDAGALTVTNVSRRFGGVAAADGVSLGVARGEFVAVVGPNGAGKSTLLQMVSGLVRPQAGEIRVAGRTIAGLKPEAIASLGVARTFQTSRVFPALSVMDSVMVGAQAALIGGGRQPVRFGPAAEAISALLRLPAYRARVRELEAAAESVMKLFGERLWPRRAEPAFSLSYANRRRLEMARALVAEPDLLLLDEPAAGMNPTETDELTAVISDLRQRRPALAIVMVEHKLQVVRELADRCVVMNQGAVIVDTTPTDALNDPRVVEAYMGARRSAAAFGRAERHDQT